VEESIKKSMAASKAIRGGLLFKTPTSAAKQRPLKRSGRGEVRRRPAVRMGTRRNKEVGVMFAKWKGQQNHGARHRKWQKRVVGRLSGEQVQWPYRHKG